MTYPFFIAKRFLLSSRRSGFISFITVIAISGVAIGTAALIIGLSILAGFEKEIRENVIGFTANIQVSGFENQPLPDYESAMERLQTHIPQIARVSPFVARQAILKARHGVDGILVKGVRQDLDVGNTRGHIVEGKYDLMRTEGAPSPLIIGKRLSRRLGAQPGDVVTVFGVTSPSEGDFQSISYRAAQFRVVGVYETGMAENDDIYAYTDLKSAQRLFRMGEGVSGYDIMVRNLAQVASTADRIQELLGYPYYAKTMFEMYKNLFAWVELQKKPVPIVLGLIIIVATVNIVGTLLMFVMEKVNEIGVLKAIGATPHGIMRVFFIEGLFIALVGTVIGNILGFGLCWVQLQYKLFSLPSGIYFMNAVPILLQAENFFIVSGVAILLSVAAAVLPSSIAGHLDPLVTLRFR